MALSKSDLEIINSVLSEKYMPVLKDMAEGYVDTHLHDLILKFFKSDSVQEFIKSYVMTTLESCEFIVDKGIVVRMKDK